MVRLVEQWMSSPCAGILFSCVGAVKMVMLWSLMTDAATSRKSHRSSREPLLQANVLQEQRKTMASDTEHFCIFLPERAIQRFPVRRTLALVLHRFVLT